MSNFRLMVQTLLYGYAMSPSEWIRADTGNFRFRNRDGNKDGNFCAVKAHDVQRWPNDVFATRSQLRAVGVDLSS